MRFVVVLAFVFFVGMCGLVSYVAAGNLSNFGSRAAERVVGDSDAPAGTDTKKVAFTVTPGQSASEIGDALAKAGLVRNAGAFRSAVRSANAENRIAAGEYELSPSMKPSEIVTVLAEGREAVVVVTVPEGRRIAEVADVVALRTPITREAFLAELDPANYSHDFLKGDPPAASLEGYLFPDTYRLRRNATARELVTMMLDTFARKVPGPDRGRAETLGLTFHEAVTLASIVEREAVVPDERPRIAGVYLNRLKRQMRLQADPTVQFALLGSTPGVVAPPTGYWKRDLSLDDLAVDSRYNTYQRAGLPPGPICNPGQPSLQAVLAPEQHDFLYFVAKEDGSHAFARTLDEHNANVAKYLP